VANPFVLLFSIVVIIAVVLVYAAFVLPRRVMSSPHSRLATFPVTQKEFERLYVERGCSYSWDPGSVSSDWSYRVERQPRTPQHTEPAIKMVAGRKEFLLRFERPMEEVTREEFKKVYIKHGGNYVLSAGGAVKCRRVPRASCGGAAPPSGLRPGAAERTDRIEAALVATSGLRPGTQRTLAWRPNRRRRVG